MRTTRRIGRGAVLFWVLLGMLVAVTGAAPGTTAPSASAATCTGFCIQDVQLTQGPHRATIEVRTSVPTTLAAVLTDHPIGTPGAPPRVITSQHSARYHPVSFGDLEPGHPYVLRLQATNQSGQRVGRSVSFVALSRTVQVTIYKIKYLNDADTNGPGEQQVFGFAYGTRFATAAEKRVATGDYLYVKDSTTFLRARRSMQLTVHGFECDDLWSLCREFPFVAHGDAATATHTVDVERPGGADGSTRQPTGNMPAGHAGYVQFETGNDQYLKFRVYAFWDLRYE